MSESPYRENIHAACIKDGRHVDACCDSDEAAGNEGCSPR